MSSRDCLLFSLSFFGFTLSGREEEEASEGGRENSLKNPGAGKKRLRFLCFGCAANTHFKAELGELLANDGGAELYFFF